MPDIKLLGAVYPDVPAVALPLNGGGTAEFFDVSGTTATAADVASGKQFYNAAGILTTGTHNDQAVSVVTTQDSHGGDIVNISGVVAQNIQPIIVRPDAVLVEKYTYDKYIVEDEKVTWPGYTTTSTTLKASQALTPTVTLDYANYNYYVIERTLSIPEYSITTKGKGRAEYNFSAAAYEIVEFPANTFSAIIDPTLKYGSRNVTLYATGNVIRLIYYSTATALSAQATAAYGVPQTITAPAVSSGVLTINSPALITRGHTTYFTTTYMSAVTDVRYQYVVEVYKAPKSSLNFNGWMEYNNALRIVECADSSNHKLI